MLGYVLQTCIVHIVEHHKFCHRSREMVKLNVFGWRGVPKFEVDVSVSSPLRSSLPSIDPARRCLRS